MSAQELLELLKTYGLRLLYGLLVLAVGLFLVHWLMKAVRKKLDQSKMEATARGFLSNLIRVVLIVLVVLTAANTLGIPMTSIVTLVASAGVAVSLALQGALSNLVGGFILLILKPIRAGEYVKVNDYEGTVRTIGAFYTELITPDNRQISLPNSSLTNTAIVNNTREGTRRIDIPFSVSYDADVDRVYAVLLEAAGKCEKLLPSPAPEVRLNQCGESSLDFFLRVWAKSSDYWDVTYFLTDEGKRALDRAGIQIPYPQMDVHIRNDRQD